MFRRLIALAVVVHCTGWMNAEPGKPVLLWDGVAPGEMGDIPVEKAGKKNDGIERTSNVSVPTITVHPASEAKRNGAAVLVCPGGGYNILASDDEWASSSARLYPELQRLKVQVEMHAFAEGGHGFGITKRMEMPLGKWPELCASWLGGTIGIRAQ